MSSRVATMTIFIEEKENVSRVNDILNDYSDIIVGRMGIPYRGKSVSVIVLILDTDTDILGALSGKIGGLKGISVKTVMKK
jgi:putative iron-only hydrogenase system regulator